MHSCSLAMAPTELHSFLHIPIWAIGADPILSKLVLLSGGIIVLSFILKLLKQPYVIAYILAGVVLGSHGLELVTDEALITNLGSFGLILLLFFIGMEISLPDLIANWRISIFGTLLQVAFSVLAVYALGFFMDWEMARIVKLGFVISLSSTAVVIKILADRDELKTKVGQNVLGILLAQDVFIVPMLIALSYLSGKPPEPSEIIMQVVGGLFIIAVIAYVMYKKHITLPFEKLIKSDHELQVFIAFAFCFGFAVVTALFGLSSALGAFVAGILVSSAKATGWVHESLHAFRVVFVALFFVSVGMLIDLDFFQQNFQTVLLLVLLIFLVNNVINAVVMRMFGQKWADSLYGGAILSQVGEFSFILSSAGYAVGIITEYTYQLIVSIIPITLVISPFWAALVKRITVGKSSFQEVETPKEETP